MFSEPSKAEQIIEDAKAALWNDLTEEVKQLMDDANEASTKANKLIAEISSLNFEKTELEKKSSSFVSRRSMSKRTRFQQGRSRQSSTI